MIYIVLFRITLRLFFILRTFCFAPFPILALGFICFLFCKNILVIFYMILICLRLSSIHRDLKHEVCFSSLKTFRSSESVVRIFIKYIVAVEFRPLKSYLFTRIFFSFPLCFLFQFFLFFFFAFDICVFNSSNSPYGQYRQLLR